MYRMRSHEQFACRFVERRADLTSTMPDSLLRELVLSYQVALVLIVGSPAFEFVGCRWCDPCSHLSSRRHCH